MRLAITPNHVAAAFSRLTDTVQLPSARKSIPASRLKAPREN
jgi:hypothetical protein